LDLKIDKPKKVKGTIIPPPDKSITHRAIIFSSIAKGKSIIENPLISDDTKRTLNAFKSIGVKFKKIKDKIIVYSDGNFKKPKNKIYCGNSGTTMRLLAGVLASRKFTSILYGDKSLNKRPMKRIIEPLSLMGAKIKAKKNNYPPLRIIGSELNPINYTLPVASAQVKSSIILAALNTKGKTIIKEPIKSRDHTERILPLFNGKIKLLKNKIVVEGKQKLKSSNIYVPSDFSSASFFIALGLIFPGAEILIKNVGINPTRTGFLKKVKNMGAKIEIINKRNHIEPVADIKVRYSKLKSINITKKDIPLLIDEIPLIAVLATQAEGITKITGAEELRVKESDRISAVVKNLKELGSNIKELPDGMIIKGRTHLKGNKKLDSFKDHRIAMAFAILSTIIKGKIIVKNFDCVKISYPNFLEDLYKLYG